MINFEKMFFMTNVALPWQLKDYDFFSFYKDFSEKELAQIVHYIEKRIETIEENPINIKKLEKAEKELEEFVLTKLDKTCYTELPRVKGPERFIVDIPNLRKNAASRRTKWLKMRMKREHGINLKINENLKKKTFSIDIDESLSDDMIEIIEKEFLNDEIMEEYKQKVNDFNDIKKRSYELQEEYKELTEKYQEHKKKYRRKCIEKASHVERWRRIIWVIEIEMRLRHHEATHNIKINRKPVSSNSTEWKNYKLSFDENELINNVFILKNNVPYRLILLEDAKRFSGLKYSIAYLEVPDDEFEACFSLLKPDMMAHTNGGFIDNEISFDLLLCDDYLTDSTLDIDTKNVRDIEYFKPSVSVDYFEDYHEESSQDELNIEDELEDSDLDDFEGDDFFLPNLYDIDDE